MSSQPGTTPSPSLQIAQGLDSRWALLLAFGVISLVSIGILGQFLFGDKLLLFTDIGSDTFYNYYANYYLLVHHVSQLQLPLWSFQLGAGASLLTLYQFLYDPFSILFYLGGAERLSSLIAWAYLLKVMCAGLFTWMYLRHLGIGLYASAIFSTLFAFNGFLMVFGQHYFYASWIVFLPLLLYTIELWMRDNKWLPLALCIGYLALNIAICWQIAVFSCLYLAFKIGIEWHQRSPRQWLAKLALTLGIASIGLALTAVLWLPEFHVLNSSPRISLGFSNSLQETALGFFRFLPPEYYGSLLARIFSNNLQGIGSEYVGYLNYYESLQLFAGVLPLLVIPQLFFVLSRRERWAACLAILLLVLFLATPGFSQLMNGFQYPHHRWGYNVIMMVLVLAAIVLNRLIERRTLSVPVLALTALFLLACLLVLYSKSGGLTSPLREYTATRLVEIGVVVILHSLALGWLILGKRRRLAFCVVLALLGTEQVLEHRDSFTKRSTLSRGIEGNLEVNFFDHGKLAVEHLTAADPTFYRVEKDHWILSLNDSLIQNYHGLDSYQSLNSPGYIDFLRATGYEFRHLNVVQWNSLTEPELADVLSVKYHLTKSSGTAPPNSELVTRIGDVSVYLRTSHLPFGFTYDSYIPTSVYASLSAEDKRRAMLQGAVLDQPPSAPLKQVTQPATESENPDIRRNLSADVLRLETMRGDLVTGTVSLSSEKLLFLSIPFDPGWTAKVNGEPKELHRVNLGFSGLYLAPGDNRIELRYTPPMMKLGAGITLLSMVVVLALLLGFRPRKPGSPDPGSIR